MTDDRAHAIPPEVIVPDNRLFLDLVAGSPSATDLFERAPRAFAEAAARRDAAGSEDEARAALCGELRTYNAGLGASAQTLNRIDSLGEPDTLCVITGQQAGFLGGPAYTAYKILTTVRLAARLERDMARHVVPVFWLASEDHDIAEINRVRWMADRGEIGTVSFAWDGKGRAVEALPITDEISQAFADVLAGLPGTHRDALDRFAPSAHDDYATWHARIWSRWFADEGLVVIEPRTLRPLATAFFANALGRRDEMRAALRSGAGSVRAAGYEPPLDPDVAGSPFVVRSSGERTRLAPDRPPTLGSDEAWSADAALRPILADSLFPTVATVLGPGEIAYHTMLRPLYESLGVPQPVVVPRHGYTLLDPSEAELLQRLDIPVESAVSPDFDPSPAIEAAVPEDIRRAFGDARTALRASLAGLESTVRELDPSLEARWRQATDRADREIEKLQDRAARVALGRRGVSAARLQALLTSVRPGGRPQERALSFVGLAARFGVQWLRRLPGEDAPGRFSHYAVTIHEDH